MTSDKSVVITRYSTQKKNSRNDITEIAANVFIKGNPGTLKVF